MRKFTVCVKKISYQSSMKENIAWKWQATVKSIFSGILKKAGF